MVSRDLGLGGEGFGSVRKRKVKEPDRLERGMEGNEEKMRTVKPEVFGALTLSVGTQPVENANRW